MPRRLPLVALGVWWALACAPRAPSPPHAAPPPGVEAKAAGPAARAPDVRYEPSPPEVVDLMLDLAAVGPTDVVYDLGCGDGRIVVEAARRGARAIGVDLDPARVEEARANVRAAGVEERARIVQGDLYGVDLREATVVTLFLQADVNLKLRPRLRAELRPGSRVVSHWHDMGDWAPDRVASIAAPGRDGARVERKVYLWSIPGTSPGR